MKPAMPITTLILLSVVLLPSCSSRRDTNAEQKSAVTRSRSPETNAADPRDSVVPAEAAQTHPAADTVGRRRVQTKTPRKTIERKADTGEGTVPGKKSTSTRLEPELTVTARLIEVPGGFPPNDLYNYVYIMKYRVLKIEKGTCESKELLVGHYNPLIPRKQISDKMDPYVDGDIGKFEEGQVHRLGLVTPIDKVWNDAIEDEYFDEDDTPKHFALRADMAP